MASQAPSTTADPETTAATQETNNHSLEPTAKPSDTPTPLKVSILKRAWKALGITPLAIMFMVKGAVAPTIAMAIYQKHSVAINYLNFGYVMIVVSITTVPILPRGQFIMNLMITVFLTCLAAAIVLLGQYAGLKARQASLPPGAAPEPYGTYNSSASAVNAIFFMLCLFGVCIMRAARTALYIPSIQFTIFIMIGFTYGPNQTAEAGSLIFVREVLYTFLTGQAISTAVSLLIIPTSSRKVFFAEATGMLQGFRRLLKAQLVFVESLESSGLCTKSASDADPEMRAEYQKRSGALKAIFGGVLALAAKIQIDVKFAERETAFGHFRGTDIHQFYKLIRNIVVPISSLSTIADISERLRHYEASEETKFGVTTEPDEPSLRTKSLDVSAEDDGVRTDWLELVRTMHVTFEPTVEILDEALLHVLILLKLVPVPKKAKLSSAGKANNESGEVDVEKNTGASGPKPGEAGFSSYLEKDIEAFRDLRTVTLQKWAEEKGLSSIFHSAANFPPNDATLRATKDPKFAGERRAIRQLNLVLYMDFLLYSVAKSILELVRFAESRAEDGTMKGNRLVLPRSKTILKWLKNILFTSKSSPAENFDKHPEEFEIIRFGDPLKGAKDPEHLPPKNIWQVFGNHMRAIPRLLDSDAVKFALRVTVATMSVAILAYLRQTHVFFIKQRVVWAVVMIAIGMKGTSGSAVFNLACNAGFSVIGMASAFANWYIVDGKTPGVIAMFAVFMAIWFYFAARYPRFLTGVVAGALTHVLVIGYALQVRVIGIKIATATGQPYYPTYELAPYRLLLVVAGSFIAYIWTIFPVPITEGSVLRGNIGASLFLLASYLSSVTATVDHRIQNKEGDMTIKSSPGRQLKKLRSKLLEQQIALLNSMRQNLVDMSWEPTFGGDFPKDTYTAFIKEIQDISQYLTVISYSSLAFSNAHSSSSTWLTSFAASRVTSDSKSHKMTSLLALLSASIRNNQALPPYLSAPEQSHLCEYIKGDDAVDLLALKHVNEPGFRALSVIEVASAAATDALQRLIELSRQLVGELDFTFQIVVKENGVSNGPESESTKGKIKAQ